MGNTITLPADAKPHNSWEPFVDITGHDIWFWSSVPCRIRFFRGDELLATGGVAACGTLIVSHDKVPFTRVEYVNFDCDLPGDIHVTVV